MDDLVEALRTKPGKLNYSTSGPATVLNFGPQLLFDLTKLGKHAAVQIAYKGGGEAALAVLSGDVDFSCGNLSSMMGNIKGGKLRALVTTTPERLKDLPDVPTARESGYPQLEAIIGWSGLYGPPGMSRKLVDHWAAMLATAAKDLQWIATTEKAGSIPRVLSPAETEKFVAEQYAVYERLGRQLQIELK
jgi:tripartite-type tricarboxylate transporter receptor subunit TctC